MTKAQRRRATDMVVKVLSGGAAMLGCFMLGWILFIVAKRGGSAINWDFFTQTPPGAGSPGGGMGSPIVGTLLMTALASLIGVPLGMLAGVFLAEFGAGTKLAGIVRFTANILVGVPSIIIGVFVYTLLVMRHFGNADGEGGIGGGFSGYAGAVALAIIILPIVARTTEDMLSLVPSSLREAALALGAPRWRVILTVLFRAAKTGILTGVILAVARVTGETAPLLFTALNSPYWPNGFGSKGLGGPTSNLTVHIFNFAMSPYERWQQLAWGASLLIMLGVLAATISCRVLIRTRTR